MRVSKYLQGRQVSKRASPGERVMGSLFTPNLHSWGGWGQDDMYAQVGHMRQWTYVAVHAICKKVGSIMPNFAYVSNQERPGHTVKGNQRGLMNLYGGKFGGSYAVESSGQSFLTVGEYRSKALSVIKDHEHVEPLEHDHPLRRLWNNPNPYDTSFQFQYELCMFHHLCGSAYPWMVPNAMPEPKPAELWVMPSHWVWPRTGGGSVVAGEPGNGNAAFNSQHGEWWRDSDRIIKYYEVRPWGTTGTAGMLKIPPSDMCMVKWKSPLDKVRGYSPLGAIAQWIDSEESITKSRWAQFQNIARPDLFISLGAAYEDATDDMIERTSAKIDQKLRGEYNYGRTMIGTPGMTVTPLSFNPTEMAYKDCLDTETECLTENGWRKYTELTLETKIACYDPSTKTIVYQVPSKITVKDYKGTMHKWAGQRIDALVTPNHRCYLERATSKMVGGEIVKKLTPYRGSTRMSKCRVGAHIEYERVWDVVRAGQMAKASEYSVLSAAPAACVTPTATAIDKYGYGKSRTKELWPTLMEPKAWLKFLGYYISEGCVSDYDVVVCQKKHVEAFRAGINSVGYNWVETVKEGECHYWRTDSRGLREHLVKECGSVSSDKKIPQYVKSWPAEYLTILFDALMLGDGSRREFTRTQGGEEETWHGQYYTISKQLADDVMEIAVKCGYTANITHKTSAGVGVFPNGTPREDCERYVVNVSPKAKLSLTPDMRSEVEYDGKIWCVTVPTSFFVVRRNGKAHITGNSEADIRDMILSALGVPKAWVGIVSEMTFGSILATLMQAHEGCINPYLAMLGQEMTKHLASRWDEETPAFSTLTGKGYGGGSETRKVKLWWDNTSPADPAQVNSDITVDLQAKAITPNMVLAMRGRPPYKHGGDDPMGAAGDVPIPLNTGDDLEDLAKLMAPMENPKQNLEAASEATEEGVDVSGSQQGSDSAQEQTDDAMDDATDPGVEEPNGAPSKSLVRKGNDPYSIAAAINRAAWNRGRVASNGVKVLNEGQIQRIVDDINAKTNSSEASVSGVKRGDCGSGSFGMGSGYGMTYEGGKFVITAMKSLSAFHQWQKRWVRKQAGPHEFSCVMALLEGEVRERVLTLAAAIDDEDLTEKGREDQPHATVFYGLHTDNATEVRDAVETFGPVHARLGKIDYFPSDEHDVVVVRVESEDLHLLNEELGQLPNTNKHPEYQPHVTLAFVKPGMGQHYVDELEGQTFDEHGVEAEEIDVEFTQLVFSPANGTPVAVDIASYAAQEAGALKGVRKNSDVVQALRRYQDAGASLADELNADNWRQVSAKADALKAQVTSLLSSASTSALTEAVGEFGMRATSKSEAVKKLVNMCLATYRSRAANMV